MTAIRMTGATWEQTGLISSGRTRTTTHATERAAIEAALAPSIANSPAGTTASIGDDAVTIRLPSGQQIVLPLKRLSPTDTVLLRGEAIMAEIRRRTIDEIVPDPAHQAIADAREQLLALVRDYSDIALPLRYRAVIARVASGALTDASEIDAALGIRWEIEHDNLPYGGSDHPWGDDQEEVCIGSAAAKRARAIADILTWYRLDIAAAIRGQDRQYRATLDALVERLAAERRQVTA